MYGCPSGASSVSGGGASGWASTCVALGASVSVAFGTQCAESSLGSEAPATNLSLDQCGVVGCSVDHVYR